MTQAPLPLAIEGQAFSEGKGWRRGQHLVDALPYIDSLTADEKAVVDRMIEEEVRGLTQGGLWRGYHTRPICYVRATRYCSKLHVADCCSRTVASICAWCVLAYPISART